MRGLNVLDVIIVLAVVALLAFAASRDFGRFGGHAIGLAPTATPAPGS
jgi:hypothetical protein